MGNRCTPTEIGWPGDGMCRYNSTYSAVMCSMVDLDGGGGRSISSLYHPHIRIHASLIRGGPEARRGSTTDPASAALWHQSYWIFTLIFLISVQTIPWYPSWIRHTAILVLMSCQVSSDVQARRGRSRRGGLVVNPRSSTNRFSTPPGVFSGFSGKRFRLLRYFECAVDMAP